jgi:Uncharacterized oxidoreductases, Fe-dependent alcohol dehydrogenase family
MENFRFCVGTEILFGKGQVNKLPEALKKYGTRVLLAYGGGSIKKTGLYDKVLSLLKDGFEVFELSGIQPNPRIESVREGARLCKERKIDMVLAVGGGSTIDCAKAVAAAACYSGEAWDLVLDSSKIKAALPVCSILTLAATGSEMDPFGVISNMKTNEKLGFASPYVLPKTSILDPTNTFTVPANQTAAGTADIISHICESYFTDQEAFVPDSINEGLLRACIKYCPIALKYPDNYEARAQLMWASSLAINGIGSTGKFAEWSCHPMEHELSAFYDITHGVGLAILTPRWMRYILSEKTVDKFAAFATNVWGFAPETDKFALANKGIDALENFFRACKIPMTLHEIGIGEDHFAIMAHDAVKFGNLKDAYVPLNEQDVVSIYKMCV